MRIFKKCKHEYKLFNIDSEDYAYSKNMAERYDFICPKCKQEISILGFDLQEDENRIRKEVNKECILSGENIDNEAFIKYRVLYRCLPYGCNKEVTGIVAYRLIKKCKDFGLDLTNITAKKEF